VVTGLGKELAPLGKDLAEPWPRTAACELGGTGEDLTGPLAIA
jgi:hypothetical protein